MMRITKRNNNNNNNNNNIGGMWQAVIDSNVIPPLVGLLKEAESEVQREVAWVIHNATSEGTFEQIQ